MCPYVQLLHRLDSGEAVDIGGIPSVSLKAQLAGLFTNLMLKSLRQVSRPSVPLPVRALCPLLLVTSQVPLGAASGTAKSTLCQG